MARPLTIFVPHAAEVLTDHLPDGDGLVAYGLLRELSRRGHTVHVAVTRADVRGALPSNLHLHYLPGSAKTIPGRLAYMFRVRRLFNTLRRTVEFDVVHQMNPVYTGVSLALLGCGLPVVLGTYVARWPVSEDLSENALRGFTGDLHWMVAVVQQMAADRLLLTGKAAQNRIPFARWMLSKLRYLGHGVDVDLFSPASDFVERERLLREQRAPRALFLANVSLRKGIVTLLQAWVHVLEQVPDARLTIAGNGPALPRARALATQLRVQGSVDFTGAVARAEAPAMFRRHAVYVLPSYGEPYAGSLQEAMSCGRPVVITDAGGVPEMVPENGGLRVPMRDAAALADAVVRLLRDYELRRAMAEANRDVATSTMTWPTIAAHLEEIYSEVVVERRATRGLKFTHCDALLAITTGDSGGMVAATGGRR